MSRFQNKHDFLAFVFDNLTVPVVSLTAYEEYYNDMNNLKLLLGGGDLTATEIAAGEKYLFEDMPKAVNLLEQYREEVVAMLQYRERLGASLAPA